MQRDALKEAVVAYLMSRGYSFEQAQQAARLITHFIHAERDRQGFVSLSLRHAASRLALSVYQTRSTYQLLTHLGWLERRASSRTTVTACRLTELLAQEIEAFDSDVAIRIEQIVAVRAQQNYDSTSCLSAIVRVNFSERLVALNRRRRERYLRGYHKRTLRNVIRVLAWFVDASRRQPGAPIVISVRQLAKATGLVFVTAKAARDVLVAWQVLSYYGDVYELAPTKLLAILNDEVELPGPEAL